MESRGWEAFTIIDVAKYENNEPYHSTNLIFISESSALPYITRTAESNGYFGFVDKSGNFKINPAQTISFGAEMAEFFYQPHKYITGNKMYYLLLKISNTMMVILFNSCAKHFERA